MHHSRQLLSTLNYKVACLDSSVSKASNLTVLPCTSTVYLILHPRIVQQTLQLWPQWLSSYIQFKQTSAIKQPLWMNHLLRQAGLIFSKSQARTNTSTKSHEKCDDLSMDRFNIRCPLVRVDSGVRHHWNVRRYSTQLLHALIEANQL